MPELVIKLYQDVYSVLETLNNYATPAAPLGPLNFATHTYNSVCSKTNLTQSVLNTPALGRNRKVSPASSTFSFLVFSKNKRIRKYVRVGKKSCIVNISSKKMEILEFVDQPKEPIDVDIYYNLHDISPNDIVTKADVMMMYPTPITRTMQIKAPHVILQGDNGVLKVPIPRHLRGPLNE